MTEPKRYYATQVVSRQSITESNDMALVLTEKKLLVELYMDADMPRDFRIQFRYEPFAQQESIMCVAMLTVIDPSNPRIEEDKDWFKWVKQAPIRENDAASITYTNTTNPSSHALIHQIYAPMIRKQVEEMAKFSVRESVTFDALSGLGEVRAKVQREIVENNKYIGIELQRDIDGYDDD